VRSQPQGEPRQPTLLRQVERLGDVVRVSRHDEVARRAAQPVGGIAPQGLVLEHPAPELDLGGRGRRRGDRLAAFGALRRRFGYARTAGGGLGSCAFAPASGCFSAVVLSCHSWSLLTLPVRLRRAMIASQAALAADIVVVYGTRCISAARRI